MLSSPTTGVSLARPSRREPGVNESSMRRKYERMLSADCFTTVTMVPLPSSEGARRSIGATAGGRAHEGGFGTRRIGRWLDRCRPRLQPSPVAVTSRNWSMMLEAAEPRPSPEASVSKAGRGRSAVDEDPPRDWVLITRRPLLRLFMRARRGLLCGSPQSQRSTRLLRCQSVTRLQRVLQI